MTSVAARSFASLLFLFALASGCTGGDGGGGDMGADAGGSAAGADAGSGVEQPSCEATPSRLIVLGDSIAACTGVGGIDAATCGPKAFHAALASSYAPGLVYENKAVPGAVTANVPASQLATVTTGAGHALVLIYIGGNDLQRYLGGSDQAAVAGFNADLPQIKANWDSVFAFFEDAGNFPDGATIIMNNQYDPFDDCTAPPYNLSATKIGLLQTYNDALAEMAASHEHVTITDQHTPFLGHGHHYNVASCPYYQDGLEYWMNDLIHPNAAGHANLAVQWQSTADTLFGDCSP